MRSQRLVVFACAALVAAFAPVRMAHADGPSLVWDAPAACPARDALLDAIRVRVDAAAWASTAPELVADVRIRALPGGFALTLETAARQEPAGKRYIEAASCAELIEAAALIIALAIDPQAAERAASGDERSVSPFALPLGEQAPAAAPEPVVGSELPAPPPATPIAKPQPEPRPAPQPPQPPKPEERPMVPARLGEKPPPLPEEPERASSPLFFVRPLARLDLGTLPSPAIGPVLQLGLNLARATLELEGGLLPAQTLMISGRSASAGALYWIGGSLGACYRLDAGPFGLAPCARVEYGRLQATGSAARGTADEGAPWLALRLGARASYPLWDALALVADAELGGLLLAAAFSAENLGPVYRTRTVVGRFGVGFEVRF